MDIKKERAQALTYLVIGIVLIAVGVFVMTTLPASSAKLVGWLLIAIGAVVAILGLSGVLTIGKKF